MKTTSIFTFQARLAAILITFFLLCPAYLSSKEAPEGDKKDRYLIREIHDKVLKYNVKLEMWRKEGFIKKFNDLALARGSSLSHNIAAERARLRLERKKFTEFIDYPREAELFLIRQTLNDILRERWDMDLSRLPQRVIIEDAVVSSRILEMKEDDQYIHLSLEIKVDTKNLREQILRLGYVFTPTRVQLYCTNLYGQNDDRLINTILKKSEYIRNQHEGLYEVYTTVKKFAAELNKMTIGPYLIHVDSVDQNKIAFTAELKEP